MNASDAFQLGNYFDDELSSSPSTQLKISHFLEEKNISLPSFWKTKQNYASPEDILRFCNLCGLSLNAYDLINLKAELFSDREIISIYEFIELIPFWKLQNQEMLYEFLEQRSNKLKFQEKTKRVCSQQQLQRKSSTLPRKASCFFKSPKNYLQQYKEKELRKQQKLEYTIQKNKNQYEYNMLLHMSEMNEHNRLKQLNQTYRAYKCADGSLKVRIFDLNKFRKEITLKEFNQIYNSFQKKKWEVKEWSREHRKEAKNINKSEKQQELRGLLVDIVNVTNILKQQIAIFNSKGIMPADKS